jgi:hypothetical protein
MNVVVVIIVCLLDDVLEWRPPSLWGNAKQLWYTVALMNESMLNSHFNNINYTQTHKHIQRVQMD